MDRIAPEGDIIPDELLCVSGPLHGTLVSVEETPKGYTYTRIREAHVYFDTTRLASLLNFESLLEISRLYQDAYNIAVKRGR